MAELAAFLEPIAARALAALLNGLLQGAALTAGVGLLLASLPRTNASMRYVIWSATLLLVVALPFAAWHPSGPAEGDELLTPSPVELSEALPMPAESPGGTLTRAGEVSTPPTSGAGSVFPVPLVEGRWQVYLMGLWLAGAFLMVIRVVASLHYLMRLQARARPLPPPGDQRLAHWFSLAGPGRRASLQVSPEVSVPMAFGITRPTILFPEGLVARLSEQELDQVGLHELAHLRRWDDWTHLFQRLAQALFFFQPAVHFIGRRLNLEREIACDDWVVALTGGAKSYACCLTRLAEIAGSGPRPALAPGALVSRRHFERRIEMLLDPKRQLRKRLSGPGLFTSLAVFSVGLFALLRFSPVVAAPRVGATPAAPQQVSQPQTTPSPETEQEETRGREQAERERQRFQKELERLSASRRELEEQAEGLDLEWEAAVAGEVMELAHEEEAELTHAVEFGLVHVPAPQLAFGEKREPAIPESEILPLLAGIARNDSSPEVREAVMRELSGFHGEEGADALISLYDSSQDDKVKDSIVRYLARNAGKKAVEKLKSIAQSDPEPKRRLLAVRQLGMLARAPRGLMWVEEPLPGVPLPPGPNVVVPAPPRPPKPPRN